MRYIIDSNIIIDLINHDPKWFDWSKTTLGRASDSGLLLINSIIFTEVSIAFKRIEDASRALQVFEYEEIPKEALFLAGKVFLNYRKNSGTKKSTLADFFIGAHAAVTDSVIVTRDPVRYKKYFRTVSLLTP